MLTRAWLYRNLIPEGAGQDGLSTTNKWIFGIILFSIFVAVMESEPVLNNTYPAAFWVTNLVFAVLFLLEYVLRLWAIGEDPGQRGARAWYRYSKDDANWIDILVTLVLWVGLFLPFPGSVAVVLRFLRVLRLMRFIKQSAWAMAIGALLLAVRKRKRELCLSFVLAFIIIVVAATLLYLFEASAQPKDFGSIPRAMWWAVVTLTTIGYGDATPITPAGKILGGLIGIFSMALVALPTGILASAFSDAFQDMRKSTADADTQMAPQTGTS